MPYTKIAKPTGADYTNVNPVGKEQYDDSGITYNSSTTFYDGIDISIWTKVAKPIGFAIIKIGMTMGLIIPLTAAKEFTAGTAGYTKISKPT